MAKNRVLSFMSNFSNRDSRSTKTPSPPGDTIPFPSFPEKPEQQQDGYRSSSPQRGPQQPSNIRGSPTRREQVQRNRANSRPISMVQTYQPPLMELGQDTLPELQPVFTYLNSHSNKLYQEGYFLKLDDQNSQGKPNLDRTWTECFAQLVGTVLSLWDAVELDAAGSEGEVLPKFINLTDASIKMIESLPTRSNDDQPLQNVLSISTAGKNRYLLHFNSHHSLVQWTAGIRLAMFEYATLQEAYTGALIAGKGKSLNNINIILARSTFKYEDWVRVRFGAGTPWRQCWCVITPPDEKEVHKLQKDFNKKKSAYDRSRPPVVKGDIKFYDTKKVTKKSRPIASISDAFSAFAIYPQSKALIDPSTLIKLEGIITIHSDPPTSTEGFVFVMPEVHAAVSGFEIMLRWLFPVFDTFALYGRPDRLVADTNDPRSLMFAMPNERRYGYLDVLDVASLISAEGSQSWSECEWRRKLKESTAKRMVAISQNGGSRRGSRRNTLRDGFNDRASIRSNPSVSWGPPPVDVPAPRTDSAPPLEGPYPPYPLAAQSQHHSRSASEGFQNNGFPVYEGSDAAPAPPPHRNHIDSGLRHEYDATSPPQPTYPEEDHSPSAPAQELRDLQLSPGGVEPVSRPPAFSHAPGTLPPSAKLQNSPELRRAKSRMSNGTLSQFAGAGGAAATQGVAQYRAGLEDMRVADETRRGLPRGVHAADDPTPGMNANMASGAEGVIVGGNRLSFDRLPESLQTQTPGDAGGAPFYNSVDAAQQPRTAVRPTVVVPAYPPPYSQGHAQTPSEDRPGSQPRSANRNSLQRKPLPAGTPVTPIGPLTRDPTSPGQASTIGSLHMDQEAFDSIQPRGNQPGDPVARQTTNLSHVSETSNYTNSPTEGPPIDQSVPARTAYDRPRSGMMRTVGGYGDSTPNTPSDIPNIDFGPTINYAAATNHLSKPSARTNNPQFQPQPQTQTQFPQPPTHRGQTQAKQPSRTLAWAPGMASPLPSSPGGLTPEEFVAQRAAIAAVAQGHARQASGSTLRANTPTPPIGAGARPGHVRNNSSFDALQRDGARPSSRGAGAALGGLVGTIDARERERRDVVRGVNSQGVLHAMGQRVVHGQGQAQSPGGRAVSPGPGPAYGQQGRARSPGPMGAYGQGGRAQSPGPVGAYGQTRHRSHSPGPRVAYGQPQQRAQSPGPMGAYGQPQQRNQSPGGMGVYGQQSAPGSPATYQQQQYYQQQMGRGRGGFRG
ncbi:hypothetical protein VE00_04267 [Pseudogymnoascus sp. WSF 3629]|nr:hypothetical protein VE00_04267 [Pseudogymnoascus sp. WSF 3629]